MSARRVGEALLLLAMLAVPLEITARLAIFGPRGLDLSRLPIVRPAARDLLELDTDPSIVWEMKPSDPGLGTLARRRTNAWGMRDREYPLAKPANTHRTAVLGSSFSLPTGVEIEDAYHSVLEERLSAKRAPRAYEFLNFAVGAHMPSQTLAMLRLRALRFDPDLIIVSATALSLPLFLMDRDRPPKAKLLDLVPSGPQSFFFQLLRARLGWLDQESGAAAPQLPEDLAGDRDVLAALAEISSETGIPVVFFRIAYDPTPPNRAEEVVEERCRALGLHYFDSRAAFRGIDPRSLWIHELDPHPNAAAHAIYAAALETYLTSEGLLDD